jgi:beta-glucanase (GH16 family)
MTYTFQDEFDGAAGSAPDPSKWGYDIGKWPFNNEAEVYTASRANSYLDGNGNLVIKATRSKVRNKFVYYSARLKTAGKFFQYAGQFEARIKVNSEHGLWPAFWLLGEAKSWPYGGEIDVLEDYGWSATETTVHTPYPDGTGMHSYWADLPVDSQFHVYHMSWTPSAISFSRDGSRYLTVSAADTLNWCYGSGDPMYLILNLAVGGAAGDPSKAVFPAEMLVDYVRVTA